MKAFVLYVAELCWLVLLLLLPTSCKKKQGCVDPNAVNYCADCTVNVGCQFDVTLMFWFDSLFTAELRQLGIDTIDIFLRDLHNFQLHVGRYSRHQYCASPPSCDSGNVLKTTLRYAVSDLPDVCSSNSGWWGGGSRCWILSYSAKTEQGVMDDGQIIVYPGMYGCVELKLE